MPIFDPFGNDLSSANPDGPNRPDMRELGLPGTNLLAGFDLEERNPALQGSKGFDTYRAMGNDPTVAMLLKTYELPQRSCDWFVDPASDDPADVALADFCHYNLWDFGSQSWDDVLRQATTGRNKFGFAPFEIVYRIDDDRYPGKVCIDKFAWRAQWTKYKWNVEEVDDPSGSVSRQLVSMSQWAPPFYEYRVIPANKLALFVRDLDGENFDGVSLLRSCYKPWWIRDRLYTIQSIGLERAYMGIPVGKLPAMFTDEEAKLMKGIVGGLRTHERAGAVFPETMDLQMLMNKLEGTTMQAAIDFHTHQIPLSGLAQFTMLGSGAVGSFALSHDQSDLFLMALNGDANYTCEVVNLDPVLPRLIDFNFPNIKASQHPKLKHGDLGQRDIDKILKGVASLAQWGVLVPDDPTEDALRKMVGLPERDGTITPEYLTSLIADVAETQSEGYTRALPRSAPAAAVEVPSPGTAPPPGGPPPPGTGVPVAAAEARYREARARAPWRRPAGRLTTGDRLQAKLGEELLAMMEEGHRRAGRVPEVPSVRLAKSRPPYQLHRIAMAEQPAKSRPAAVAQKHKEAIAGFLAARAKGTRTGTVPLPKGAKLP